jgi:hypothetical protein
VAVGSSAAAARARRGSGTSVSSGSHASGSLAGGASSTSGHVVRLQALACGTSSAAAGRNASALCVKASPSDAAADTATQWFQSFDD